MGEKEARIIAVANEKGGVGKTVTVLNLGAALSRNGYRTLIVDMDPQANASKGLGIQGDGSVSVYNLLMDDDSVSASEAVLQTGWPNLDVISSHIDLSGAEVELADVPGRENRLKDALRDLTGTYDFILVDTPPSLSLLTINVFTFAKEVLIPCQTHPYSYGALEELFDTIQAVNQEINPDLAITGILPTLYDRRTRVSHRILEKLRQDDRYRSYLLNTIIRINTTIADSADVGKPVVFYRSTSSGSKDYMDLAVEIGGGK